MKQEKFFYACYPCDKKAIAVFTSREKRDAWINLQDKYTRENPLCDKWKFSRTSMSANDAKLILGAIVYIPKFWWQDKHNEGMFWVLSTMKKELLMSKGINSGKICDDDLFPGLKRKHGTAWSGRFQQNQQTIAQPTTSNKVENADDLRRKIREELIEELGMKEYKVSFREAFNHDVTIVAENESKAKEKAIEKYGRGGTPIYCSVKLTYGNQSK